MLKIKDEYVDQVRYARPDALNELQCSLCRSPIDDDVVPMQFWDGAGGCITLCYACAGKAVVVEIDP